MAKEQYQKRFLRTNKYQKKIIALVFFPAVIIIVFMWIVMTVFYREMVGVILFQSSSEAITTINHWGVIVFLGLVIVLAGVLFLSFSISLQLVGAFERIIRELDDVIAGKTNKPLKARPKDELANELLKRINVFIANLPRPRTKLKR